MGLRVYGEWERDELYFKFPVLEGAYSRRTAEAWFVNLLRRLGPFWAGFEAFRVDPDYGGGYDSRRGGVVLYTDRAGLSEDQAMLAEYPLVDDNDDNDRYSDDNIKDFPGSGEIESGVFPGLDEDHDNVPDDDRNLNGVPDYQEPFLLYYSDPQDFVYGVDMNNNGVIDRRENDDLPDYPYRRDTRGFHAFLSWNPTRNFDLTLGWYRVEQIAGGGRAVSRYARFSFGYRFPRLGEVEVYHDSKRVEDTIPDPVYVYKPGRNNDPTNPPDPDPLLMEDSWVHTSFVRASFTGVPGLRVSLSMKGVWNLQMDEHDLIRSLAAVQRADYELKLGRLTLRPMLKVMEKQVKRRSRPRPQESWTQFAPILRADVKLTDRTALRLGWQGVRLPVESLRNVLAFRYRDGVDPSSSYSSTDFVLMVSNRTDYMGYKIVSDVGVQFRSEEYEEELVARTRNARFTRFFVNVVVGY